MFQIITLRHYFYAFQTMNNLNWKCSLTCHLPTLPHSQYYLYDFYTESDYFQPVYMQNLNPGHSIHQA